jgi:hypothetical protein
MQPFIALISAIWDQRKMSLILLEGFLRDYFEFYVHTYARLELKRFGPFAVLAITCDKPSRADHRITDKGNQTRACALSENSVTCLFRQKQR